jgi:hypothetical protein
MRLYMDTEKNTTLGVQDPIHWKMHLSPLPSAWPLTRSGDSGHWIRYGWAVIPRWGSASEIWYRPGVPWRWHWRRHRSVDRDWHLSGEKHSLTVAPLKCEVNAQ